MSGPLLSLLPAAACIALPAGAGALANCALLAALLKTPRNGFLTVVMQLALADFIIFGTVVLELWSQNSQTWSFGAASCMVYKGLDVLTSTVTVYFILTIALHALSAISVEERAAKRSAKTTFEDNEIQSSRHSLMANSDSSTPPRTMHIDYRRINNNIPVITPCIFIWVLAVSLSIPEFVLATAVQVNNTTESCTFKEPSYLVNMHTMLAVFNLFLPVMLLAAVGILIIIKLNTKCSLPQFHKIELLSALTLSLWLIITYVLLSLPRSVLTMYVVYSTPENDPPFQNALYSHGTLAGLGLALSWLYLLASALRPLLCIMLSANLRGVFKSTVQMHENV